MADEKFGSINCLASATFPPGYQDLLNYLGGSNPNLSAGAARNTLTQLAESVRLANTEPRTEVLRAIFTQPGNRDTAPFGSVPTIPGTIYASDYDQGMNGHAYADAGWENVLYTTGDYTAWNERWTYRNGGVDIETCSDPDSNGYNVCFFKPNEWMKYTVEVASPGPTASTCAWPMAPGKPPPSRSKAVTEPKPWLPPRCALEVGRTG